MIDDLILLWRALTSPFVCPRCNCPLPKNLKLINKRCNNCGQLLLEKKNV